jgi:hypothetical protein
MIKIKKNPLTRTVHSGTTVAHAPITTCPHHLAAPLGPSPTPHLLHAHSEHAGAAYPRPTARAPFCIVFSLFRADGAIRSKLLVAAHLIAPPPQVSCQTYMCKPPTTPSEHLVVGPHW